MDASALNDLLIGLTCIWAGWALRAWWQERQATEQLTH